MRGTTKVRGANIATVRDPDDALQLVSDALDDDGVSFVVLEKAGGSYFVRASYAAPSFIGRDDD